MKGAFVLFTVWCATLPIAAPQTATPKPEVREQPMSADEAAIRQISEDWIRFYNAGDATKVAALYTDNGYYLSAHILGARQAGDRGLLGTRHQGGRAHRFHQAADASTSPATSPTVRAPTRRPTRA